MTYTPLPCISLNPKLLLPNVSTFLAPQSFQLLKLSQTLVMEVSAKWDEVGRRGKLWGREEGLKNPWAGEKDNKNALLGCVWVHPKTDWMASSWNGALVAAGSLRPTFRTCAPVSSVNELFLFFSSESIFRTCQTPVQNLKFLSPSTDNRQLQIHTETIIPTT